RQPLLPRRHHLPRHDGADDDDRLPGGQRRWLGALRRPGEGPADHRLPAVRLRPRLAAALPPMISTALWYLATDQWRYDGMPAEALASPLAEGRLAGRTTADTLVEASKRGWMPSYPSFNRNPLDIADEAAAAGKEVPQHVVDELAAGRL